MRQKIKKMCAIYNKKNTFFNKKIDHQNYNFF